MLHTMNVKFLLVVFTLAFFVAPSTPPQSLADWQAALEASKRGKGCESIPYSNHRSTCISNSSKVESSCKTEAWSCDDLGTKAFKATMEALSGHIDRLGEQKKQLESQRTRAGSATEKADLDKKIDDVDKQILQKTRTLNDSKTKLNNDLVKIKARANIGKECLAARKAVQAVFAKAGDDAKGVTNPAIKPIADSLIKYWETKGDEHQTALKNVQLGIDKCIKSEAGLL